MTDQRRRDRGGFTLVELVVVVTVIGFLAALAMPNLERALLKARATDAISDLQVIRVAVMSYVGDYHTWPVEVGPGNVPPGLGPYLPDGFDFSPDGYTIDYDNWLTHTQGFVGLAVTTDDPLLGQEMVNILGPNTWTDGSTKFTWVIEWK